VANQDEDYSGSTPILLIKLLVIGEKRLFSLFNSRGKDMQRTSFIGIDALSRRPLAFLAFSIQVQSKANAE